MYGLVQGERNDVAPGKRPLSSMAPTIVTKDGRLRDGDGQPGRRAHHHDRARNDAQRAVYGMNAQHAVDAPRTHMQWLPDEIEYEPDAFDAAIGGALRRWATRCTRIPAGAPRSRRHRSAQRLARRWERPSRPGRFGRGY